MIKTLKEYIVPIFAAFVLFTFCSVSEIDRLFFNYPNIDYHNKIIIKILFFVFLCVLFCFGSKVCERIKAGDKTYKRGVLIFSVYFSIMSFLILLTWPGLWAWDDIYTLECDYEYVFHSWQHILTSIFHQIFLQILPFPCGIIILQNFIISIAVAFITVKIENTYNIFLKNKFFDITVKLLPFLLFPVLRFQLSGYRYSVYLMFEITFLCILLCSLKEKKEESTAYLILFSVVCAVSAVWRSESFIYFIVGILFPFFAKYTGGIKKRIISIIVLISVFLTISPATALIHHLTPEKDKETLEKINKVLDTDKIQNNPDMQGITLFWTKAPVRNGFTEKEYHDYLKALFAGSIKYPKVIMKERTKIWKETFFPARNRGVDNSNFILAVFKDSKEYSYIRNFFKNTSFVLNKTISERLRTRTVYILNCSNNQTLNFIYYNSYLPLFVILIASFYAYIKKRKAEELILALVLFKQILIMFTQPDSNFQYYFTVYFIGYFIFCYTFITIVNKIIDFIQKRKHYD